jgi:hypothetical protein
MNLANQIEEMKKQRYQAKRNAAYLDEANILEEKRVKQSSK